MNSFAPGGASLRIAAIGDLHLSGHPDDYPRMRALFAAASATADVLALCGDITRRGQPHELQPLIEASDALEIPGVAVLGNHDGEGDREEAVMDLLETAGIDVLEGTSVVIDDVGFAGTKGFGGGFDGEQVGAGGERVLKRFVEQTLWELDRLEHALATLDTPRKVVLLHYAPVTQTLVGEPPALWPFLGCSRFETAIDREGAEVVFHGHAHRGASKAATRRGVPVFNVAAPVLAREGLDFRVWTVPQGRRVDRVPLLRESAAGRP